MRSAQLLCRVMQLAFNIGIGVTQSRLPIEASRVAVAAFSILIILLSTAELPAGVTTQEDNGQVLVLDMGRCGQV